MEKNKTHMWGKQMANHELLGENGKTRAYRRRNSRCHTAPRASLCAPAPSPMTPKPMQVRAGETIGNGWGSICRSPE